MRRLGVVVLCLVQFVDVLGVTSVVTALPVILRGIHANAAATGPIITSYAVFFGAVLVLGARLGDRYGHRRILVIGIATFGAVSIVGATATGVEQLLVARAVQGVAAAFSAPSALRLILRLAPDGPARSRALAAWSGVGAAAGATGFLVGGVLTSVLGWAAVFWINAPVAAVLIVGVLAGVRTEPPERDTAPLDVLGAGLLVAATMPLVAGAPLLETAGTRVAGVALVLAGGVVAAVFARRMLSARTPLIPRAAFASRNLRRGAVQSFMNTASTSSSTVLATLVLQDRLGLTSLLSGLTLMAFSLAVVSGSPVAGRLAEAIGLNRLAGLGLSVIGIGNAVLAVTVGSWWGLILGICASGFGLALASVAATSTGTSVPAGLAGAAAGVINTGAQLGTALGTAAVVLIATGAGIEAGWWSAAVIALGTAAWCLARQRRSGRAQPQ